MITLRHADVVITLDESDGGRATSWSVSGRELLGRNSSHPIDYGMYPMAPWAGRIRDNRLDLTGVAHSFPANFEPWAIHGLVLNRRFEVIERTESSAVLERAFGDAWPYDGGVRCAWELDAHGLTTEITCYSRNESFPAVVGWHPWFRREVAGAQAAWKSDCIEILVRGDDSLPTGERQAFDLGDGPFDDVITGGRKTSIEWPTFLRIEIENSHPWFVVYDATEIFICIEPQTGPSDGLSGRLAPMATVSPERPLVMRTRWNLRRGPQAAGA